MARTATRSAPARRGIRWAQRIGIVLVVAGITVAPVAGRTARAVVVPPIEVTAQNGYSAPEVDFLNYLEHADFALIRGEPEKTLYAVGRDACAAFGKGDTEAQVFQTEKAVAPRRGIRISAAQIGALVPVAVLKLCPAYLPTVTISVD